MIEPREEKLTVQGDVTFRLATRLDLPKLEWHGQYTHFRTLFKRTFQEMQNGQRLMLVADFRSFPIGQVFIQLRSEEKYIAEAGLRAYLYSLRVMEMFQGMGIGKQLLHTAEEMVSERGYYWVSIAAAKVNLKARQMYERLGYRVFAEDAGKWSYTDHRNVVRFVHEPCWLLEKRITFR